MGNSPTKDYKPFFDAVRKGSVADILPFFSTSTPPSTYYTLIERDYNTERYVTPGDTPLHTAVYNPNNEVMELLLSLDFPFLPNSVGDTPLHLCARHGSLGKIRLVFASMMSSSSATSRLTSTDLKKHSNNHGKRPYDLLPTGVQEECTLLLRYEDCEGYMKGFQNNILEDICRLGVIRDEVKMGCVCGDTDFLIFTFSKGQRTHRVFTLEIGSDRRITLNGPVSSLKRVLSTDGCGGVIEHSIRECCILRGVSMHYIFEVARVCHTLLDDSKEYANAVYRTLYILKGVEMSTPALLDELVSILETTVSDRFVPSIVSGKANVSAEKLPMPCDSNSPVHNASIKKISVVDNIKRIRSATLSSIDARRTPMYVGVCQEAGMCPWLNGMMMFVVYKGVTNNLRVYTIEMRDDDLVVEGPIAESSILHNHPIIEQTIVLHNVSLQDIILGCRVTMMLGSNSILPNLRRRMTQLAFDTISTSFSTSTISRVDTKYISKQLEEMASHSLVDRMAPSKRSV